jgi:putative membrane protein
MFKKAIATTLILIATLSTTAQAETPADLDDLEIAHVAYTADNIDIRYAHLALAMSKNPAIREFAETMIRDHGAVNDKALALVAKLNVAPKDNFLSQQLNSQADILVAEMSQLRGDAFDKRYAENEFAYHGVVNGLVEGVFIPNLKHPEFKALFEEALVIFKAHEKHAKMMVDTLKNQGS